MPSGIFISKGHTRSFALKINQFHSQPCAPQFTDQQGGQPLAKPSHPSPAQVLTRQQQLAAKNQGKEDPPNPEQVMKRPSARVPKAKAQGKSKAKAKAKAKASASPKKKSTPKKRPSSKRSQQEAKEDQEEEAQADEDAVMKTPKRKLFQSDEEVKEDKEPGATSDEKGEPEEEKEKPKPKRAKAKAKAKSKPGALDAADGAAPPDQPEPQPKKRSRKPKKEEVEGVEALQDDVMKGVFLQRLKEVKTMTFDDLKGHLTTKKTNMANQKAQLNVYWTRTTAAVRLMLDKDYRPDVFSFSFKNGTWNARMCTAFVCAMLADP